MKTKKSSILKCLVYVSVLFLALPLASQFRDNPFGGEGSREPDIRAEAQYDKGLVLFKFDVDPDHHITDLKNNFFTIELEKNDYFEILRTDFPKGVPYEDEMVFKGKFDVKVYLKTLKDVSAAVTLKFKISYQMCQEQPQSMCYAPEGTDLSLTVNKPFQAAEPAAVAAETAESGKKEVEDESYAQWVERVIKEELKNKSLLLFALVFVAGFLTSFTPCVYPVIPIVMGYVGSRSGTGKLKGFYLSVFFVLGLAIVYSILGVIAATTGSMMGVSFQNPIVVVVIAAIFVVMGLSLAGLFEIPIPTSISSKMQAGKKGGIFGAMLVGGVSGVIAAPCVGPVLIALLSWISQTGDIVLGFWLTFVFSLGLGVIFLIVGTFSGVISAMPKGGKWMDYVKYAFSLLLLAGGVYFVTGITPVWLDYLLWGIFLMAASVFMGLFKPLEEDGFKGKFYKLLLVLILVVGAFFFMRALETKYFPTTAAGPVKTKVGPSWIKNLDEGKRIAKEQNKIVMIDTYADWCVACKELDKYTFSQTEVIDRLKKDFVTVKLDFTKRSDENEAMRRSLGVVGMPTIIFLSADGKELKRFAGFKDKNDFLAFLDTVK